MTNSFKRQAQSFSLEQRDPEKARQVYLNTLAIQAVCFYCDCMGIETDLEASESWNLVSRTLMDVADLVILGRGRLECRPILPGEEVCLLPPEVQEDRLGYIVVAIDEEAYEAKLLGFSPVFQSRLVVRQLASLDDALDMLMDEKPISETTSPGGLVPSLSKGIVYLGQWFADLFDELWQEPTLVLAASYRGAGTVQESNAVVSRKRAKLLEFGDYRLAIVLQVTQLPDAELNILLRICSADRNVLPQGLTLQLLDPDGDVALEDQTKQADNAKEFTFQIDVDSSFSLRLSLGNINITENFQA
ncbi:MAG: DUF1822 family protein [Cyanobacteria bacterium P01_C01_bin.120]